MFLSEHPADKPHAGSKARNDVEGVMSRMGLRALARLETLPEVSKWRKALYLCAPSYLARLARLLRCHDAWICLQYPFYYDPVTRGVLEQVVRRNHTILIVHDVDAWRDVGKETLAHTQAVFNRAEVLIVHNARMKARLEAEGIRTPMICLDVFDYLLPGDLPHHDRTRRAELSFAGNLSKSTFLHTEDIAQLPLTLHLYGIGFSPESIHGTDIQYHGSYPPERIPYELTGSFGLIWDGNVIDTCSGLFGNYMRYNNPHKLSLYIAAAMPVITWRQAAIADFVQREQIGIVVDSLAEVPERIAALTDDAYEGFLVNIQKLQVQVCRGMFMRRALERAITVIQQKQQ